MAKLVTTSTCKHLTALKEALLFDFKPRLKKPGFELRLEKVHTMQMVTSCN